jgi:hypothetical protein
MVTERVSLFCATLGLAAILILSAAHAPADVIVPPGLPVGAQYQVIFLTHDTTPATNADIGFYNTFVSNEAALSPDLPAGTTWMAIASTPDMDAKNNVTTSSDIPIYTPDGVLVASSGSALWQTGLISPQLLNPVMTDQYGDMWVMDAWTGSKSDGTKVSGRALGQWSLPDVIPVQGPEFGLGVFTTSRWLDVQPFSSRLAGSSSQALSVYALSSVVTVPNVVPEPSALALLAVGTMGLLAVFSRRRSKKG